MGPGAVAAGDRGAYNEKTFIQRANGMRGPDRRGPTPLADILGALFAARGYGRLRAVGELEGAWVAAVGEATARQTRLGSVRHGVLTITVAHPTLLEEL